MKQLFNLDLLYVIPLLIGTWRTTEENSTTTRHMARLGQLIRNYKV
jgi:hypothetical protein